jgi:hypothetical protein
MYDSSDSDAYCTSDSHYNSDPCTVVYKTRLKDLGSSARPLVIYALEASNGQTSSTSHCLSPQTSEIASVYSL